jgi:hypothetical protein
MIMIANMAPPWPVFVTYVFVIVLVGAALALGALLAPCLYVLLVVVVLVVPPLLLFVTVVLVVGLVFLLLVRSAMLLYSQAEYLKPPKEPFIYFTIILFK